MRRTRNRLTSSLVIAVGIAVAAVAVEPERLPEGATGIAARYPGDAGISRDEAVLFADDFEDCRTPADLRRSWGVLVNEKHLAIATGDAAHTGRRALLMTVPRRKEPLATGVARMLDAGCDRLFLRWYMRYEAGWKVPAGSVHNGATVAARYFVDGRATPGVRSDGRNKFLVSCECENSVGEAPGKLNLYVYWPEQGDRWGDHFFPSGTVLPFSHRRSGAATFGAAFAPREDFTPEPDRWYCYEHMVQANAPGVRDGRVAVWVDGRLVADFPNLRLRDVDELKIDRFGLDLYIAANTERPNRKWHDDVVAATAYIGPRVAER